MEEDKISFVLYSDQRGQFDKLSDEQAGKLVKHIFSYVNLEYPEGDFITELAFEPIKTQLKRDKKKWESVIKKRSDAGKASAEAKKNKRQQASTNSTSVESVETKSTNPTVSVNGNVSVISVSDTVINKYPKGLDFFSDDPIFLDSFSEWVTYRKEMRKPIRGQKAFQGQLSKLNRLSGGDYQKAKNIILQSIENNWTGLFELKNQTNDKSKQPRGEQIIDHNARIRKELRENQGRSSTGPL